MSQFAAHISLVRLIWLEQRDDIRNIRAAAAKAGNSLEVRAARASLETISIKEHKLQALADLGAFLRELEAHHVDAA